MTEAVIKEYIKQMVVRTPQLQEYGFSLHINWDVWAEINDKQSWEDEHQELLYEQIREIAKSGWDQLYENSSVILFKDLSDIMQIKLALGGKWITGIVDWNNEEIVHSTI